MRPKHWEIGGDRPVFSRIWPLLSSWADDFRQSIKYNEQARQIFVQLDDVEGECNVGANLGLDYLWLGMEVDALNLLDIVSEKAREHRLGHVEVFARTNLARVLLFAGELDMANECLTRSQALAVQLDIKPEYAEILRLQADIALQNGSLEVAEAKAKAAVFEAAAVNERQHGCALRTMANVCWSLGQTEFALSSYQESLALLIDESRFEYARTQMALGCRILSTDSEQAVELLRPAMEVFRAVGASRELAQAKACLQKN